MYRCSAMPCVPRLLGVQLSTVTWRQVRFAHLSVCHGSHTLTYPSDLRLGKGCKALLSLCHYIYISNGGTGFHFLHKGCTQTQHVRSAVSWQRGGAQLRKALSIRAAGALIGDDVASMTSCDQQQFIVACAVKRHAKTQTAVRKSDSDQAYAKVISSKSVDGDGGQSLRSF